ncbi:hypothetical protein BH24ACT13_BH24ACT13_04670 [soil metagenome]
MNNLPLVFTTDDALRAGFTAWQVRRRVVTGAWVTLRPGVMSTADTLASLSDDPLARHLVDVRAARLAVARPTWASHQSAAYALGLPLGVPVDQSSADPEPSLVQLTTQPGNARTRRYPGVRIQVATVPSWQRAFVADLPTTSVARTVVDLCRHLPVQQAVPVADDALHRRLVTPGDLAAVARTCHQWPGIARARRSLTVADGRRETPLESVSALAFLDLQLPEPEPQVWILDPRGFAVARVDFLFRELGMVGEADGRGKYFLQRTSNADAASAVWAEKRREDALRDLGLEVFRWTWFEAVHRPDMLRERFNRARDRALARGPGTVTAHFARPSVRLGPDLYEMWPRPTSKVWAGEESGRRTA